MNELTSFNQLLFEAASAGLLLQQFHQAPDGRWIASWRRGSGPGATHYPTATHERPFDALLKAFIMAFGVMQIKATKACSPEGEAGCSEPWHWDDGVPYCDTCGVFRQSKTGVRIEPINDSLFAFGAMQIKPTKTCSPKEEAGCSESWTWNDNVPYCDTCGLFRLSKMIARDKEQKPSDDIFA